MLVAKLFHFSRNGVPKNQWTVADNSYSISFETSLEVNKENKLVIAH